MSGLSTVWAVVAAVVVAAVVVATIVVVLRTSTLVRSSLNRLRSSTRRAVEDELPASMSRLRTEGPGAARSLTQAVEPEAEDRKSTRLNSSHVASSYAVFFFNKTKN